MTRVYLGVGSNLDRDANIAAGLEALHTGLGLSRASSAWESDAIGFEGPAFLNLAVELETGLGVAELARFLRQLEYRMGRPRDATRFSSRTLDIDILTFGDRVGVVDGVELPRQELLENAFVLAPMAELVPDVLHPARLLRYDELWGQLRQSMQPVRRVDFRCRGWTLPWEA